MSVPTEVCVGCDQPTGEPSQCLLGVLCPICKTNLTALAEAVEQLGGFVPEKAP